MLVEDNPDTLKMLARIFTRFGYTVLTATGVKEAIALAGREPFDLLVSDIGLPDGTGWDIMRQLKLKQSVRGIALSGFGMDDDIHRSHEAGFAHHLVKPVDLNVLQSVVQKMTASRN